MRAKKTTRNNYDGLYEALGRVRKSERELAELCVLGYAEVYTCGAGDGVILDNKHSYKADGKYWHSKECADEAEATKGTI